MECRSSKPASCTFVCDILEKPPGAPADMDMPFITHFAGESPTGSGLDEKPCLTCGLGTIYRVREGPAVGREPR